VSPADGAASGFALHLRHEIVVDRPIAAVFAVATTVRRWPAWHPATLRVEILDLRAGRPPRAEREGDAWGADRSPPNDGPARLGDRIVEHVRIADHEGSGTWTVTACEPPHRLVLDSTDAGIGHIRISYTVTEEPGGTRFVRELDLPPVSPPVEAAMHAQSAAGLAALLEREIPAAAPR
jgi:uncharacterized protein YndB with AHSA1/START domain